MPFAPQAHISASQRRLRDELTQYVREAGPLFLDTFTTVNFHLPELPEILRTIQNGGNTTDNLRRSQNFIEVLRGDLQEARNLISNAEERLESIESSILDAHQQIDALTARAAVAFQGLQERDHPLVDYPIPAEDRLPMYERDTSPGTPLGSPVPTPAVSPLSPSPAPLVTLSQSTSQRSSSPLLDYEEVYHTPMQSPVARQDTPHPIPIPEPTTFQRIPYGVGRSVASLVPRITLSASPTPLSPQSPPSTELIQAVERLRVVRPDLVRDNSPPPPLLNITRTTEDLAVANLLSSRFNVLPPPSPPMPLSLRNVFIAPAPTQPIPQPAEDEDLLNLQAVAEAVGGAPLDDEDLPPLINPNPHHVAQPTGFIEVIYPEQLFPAAPEYSGEQRGGEIFSTDLAGHLLERQRRINSDPNTEHIPEVHVATEDWAPPYIAPERVILTPPPSYVPLIMPVPTPPPVFLNTTGQMPPPGSPVPLNLARPVETATATTLLQFGSVEPVNGPYFGVSVRRGASSVYRSLPRGRASPYPRITARRPVINYNPDDHPTGRAPQTARRGRGFLSRIPRGRPTPIPQPPPIPTDVIVTASLPPQDVTPPPPPTIRRRRRTVTVPSGQLPPPTNTPQGRPILDAVLRGRSRGSITRGLWRRIHEAEEAAIRESLEDSNRAGPSNS